jgi:hypothetical protein
MGAEVFASPITVVIALLIVLASSSVYYAGRRAPLVSKRRLVVGYASVVLACAMLSALDAYVSPEEAASKWHVPLERYWSVLINQYVTTVILMGTTALIGIAIVGFPIIVTLDKFGVATTPNVLLASILVSTAPAVLLSGSNSTPFQHLAITLAYIGGTHLALALSFCLGAGLPWRRLSRANDT